MKWLRPTFFLLLMTGIAFSIYLLLSEKQAPPFSSTLSPLFQELGKPIHSIDRAITKLTPISEIDEKLLGESIRENLKEQFSVLEGDSLNYLQSLVKNLTSESQKGFTYSVHLVTGSPNAFALPGGVICVTDGLLKTLTSEAELVSVLGHEIGHIERGHLFDAARGEMLRRKISRTTPFDYAIDTIQFVSHFFFSKAQENEADEYAFKMLIKKGYDPFGAAEAFEKLLTLEEPHNGATNPFNDFFSTHPYMQLRADKFRSLAERWRKNYPDVEVYIGKLNLEQKKSRYDAPFPQEWRPKLQ